jgi:hypothetical protein
MESELYLDAAIRQGNLEHYVVLSSSQLQQMRDRMIDYARQQAPLVSEDEVASITYETLYKKPYRDSIAVADSPEMAALLEDYCRKEALVAPLDIRVDGRDVYGNIPLDLAEKAALITLPEQGQYGIEWNSYTVFKTEDYAFRCRLLEQQIDVLQQIKEAGLYHEQTSRLLEEAREAALYHRAELYFHKQEGQLVVTPDPISEPYERLAVDRRMYLIEEVGIPSKLCTLVRENGAWSLRSSQEEATWAPVIRSLEELERVTEGRFLYLNYWDVPDKPHYTLEKRPGVVFVQEGESWKALPDYKLFTKDAQPAPQELKGRLECVSIGPELDPPNYSQWFSAYKLAQGYGHEWGNLSSDQFYSAMEVSKTNIELENRIVTARLEKCGPVGGIFPQGEVKLGAFGREYMLSHITGTGRLSWEVRQRGDIEIEISRPPYHEVYGQISFSEKNVALWAIYSSSTLSWELKEVNANFLPRHAEAFIKAAEATGQGLPAELRHQLRSQALENEARQVEFIVQALQERFGQLLMNRLDEAIRNGEARFNPDARDFEYSESLQQEMGRDFVRTLSAAYRDVPPVAERLLERSQEFSLER